MFKTGILYLANLEATEDVIVNQGGTSSGKTYAILQALCSKAISQRGLVITVAGQDIPNLKSGALRDMETIVDGSEQLRRLVTGYNKTERTFSFRSGSIMEFKSYDDAQDAKSGKRDYLFINEANGIPYEVYTELEMRTRMQVYIDYNPNAEFWVHEKVLKEPSVKLLISDHRHNPFLSARQHARIEALKDKDEEMFKVYARGLTGKIEGLIFRNYVIVDAVPAEAELIAYGLDFGFTNDPTGLLAVYRYNGELYLDELLYETGLTNQAIGDKMGAMGVSKYVEVVADSAEPKSIAEISNMGFRVLPAEKGPDSVKNSIDIIKRFKLNVTRRSTNLRKELGSYKWKVKDGKPINVPVDFLNHLIDPLRYVGLNKLANSNSGVYSFA